MKKKAWKLIKEDERTTAKHYVSNWGRIIFWEGKFTFAIAPKGKRTRYLRHVYGEDWDLIFTRPDEAYEIAYQERSFEERNVYRWDFRSEMHELIRKNSDLEKTVSK